MMGRDVLSAGKSGDRRREKKFAARPESGFIEGKYLWVVWVTLAFAFVVEVQAFFVCF